MSSPKSIAAALLINAGLGVLYIWSLFLGPLESQLAVDRATLSFVPALALVGFTVGMVIQAGALRVMSPGALAALSLGLAGAGHVLFGLVPSVPTLISATAYFSALVAALATSWRWPWPRRLVRGFAGSSSA